jgi:hypothetical protein
MEINLPNPKAVLANEAFPKGSPKPACVITTFSSLDNSKNWERAGSLSSLT